MSTFKIGLVFFLLFIPIGSLSVDALHIGVSSSYVDWYIDPDTKETVLQFPTDLIFDFEDLNVTDKVDVYIEGVDPDLFYLKTFEKEIDGNKTITATLYANVSSKLFYKVKWDFLIAGEIQQGGTIYRIVSNINVYTCKTYNVSFLVIGLCSISLVIGSGYVLNRRKEQHEKN